MVAERGATAGEDERRSALDGQAPGSGVEALEDLEREKRELRATVEALRTRLEQAVRDGDEAVLRSLEAWQMRSIWTEE